MPDDHRPIISFIKEIEHFYVTQQRNGEHPICIHCVNSVSRSAVFIAAYSCVQIIDSYLAPTYLAQSHQAITSDTLLKLVKQMRSKRKYMLQSTLNLKYLYDLVLAYAKQVLIKEGALKVEQTAPQETVRQVLDLESKLSLDLMDVSGSRPKASKRDFIEDRPLVGKVQLNNDPFSWLDPLKK